jgi:hypothetical protein
MAKQTRETPPWKALGFVQQDVDGRAEEVIGMFKGWNSPPGSPGEVLNWDVADQFVFTVHLIASRTFAMGALGYTIKHPVLRDWREAGRQLVAADLYYFFGSWREKVRWYEHSFTKMSVKVLNRKQARAKLKWISYYRTALMTASSLSDWKSADRLLEWPGPDLNDDEGMGENLTAEDNAYQIWLAMRLRGESGSEVDARRDLIARRSRQRPKLLALAANALFAEDSDQLAKTLADYLKYYRQREIGLGRDPGQRLVRDGISPDGTILWHLARRRGLGEIKLPEELMIMIARP